jgi:hypothetical protein
MTTTEHSNGEKIYAAKSYPPEAIPQVLAALCLLRRAHQVLDQVVKTDGVEGGSPAEYSRDEVSTAISYLEADEDEDDENGPDDAPRPGPRLVVDNSQLEVPRP